MTDYRCYWYPLTMFDKTLIGLVIKCNRYRIPESFINRRRGLLSAIYSHGGYDMTLRDARRNEIWYMIYNMHNWYMARQLLSTDYNTYLLNNHRWNNPKIYWLIIFIWTFTERASFRIMSGQRHCLSSDSQLAFISSQVNIKQFPIF